MNPQNESPVRTINEGVGEFKSGDYPTFMEVDSVAGSLAALRFLEQKGLMQDTVRGTKAVARQLATDAETRLPSQVCTLAGPDVIGGGFVREFPYVPPPHIVAAHEAVKDVPGAYVGEIIGFRFVISTHKSRFYAEAGLDPATSTLTTVKIEHGQLRQIAGYAVDVDSLIPKLEAFVRACKWADVTWMIEADSESVPQRKTPRQKAHKPYYQRGRW